MVAARSGRSRERTTAVIIAALAACGVSSATSPAAVAILHSCVDGSTDGG